MRRRALEVGHKDRREGGPEKQQTNCPEGQAHYCLANTVLINNDQSESTYPAARSIITLSLAVGESRGGAGSVIA